MTALAPPIWELAGASPQAMALEDHRRRVTFGELEERTNAFGHGLEALSAACEARLASYQRPRRLIVRDALPRDPTGKVLRHVLRGELWEGRGSNFAAPSR